MVKGTRLKVSIIGHLQSHDHHQSQESMLKGTETFQIKADPCSPPKL